MQENPHEGNWTLRECIATAKEVVRKYPVGTPESEMSREDQDTLLDCRVCAELGT